MICEEINNDTFVSENNLFCSNCKKQKFSDACNCLTEDLNNNHQIPSIASNLKTLNDLAVRLDEYLSKGVQQTRVNHQEVKSAIERNYQNIIENFEQYKNELSGELKLNEMHFNEEWADMKRILDETWVKIKTLSTGDNSSTTEINNFNNEIQIIQERIERVLRSISEVAVYKKPTSDILQSNFTELLLGSIEYQDYDSLLSYDRKINIQRLEKTKYNMPRVLKYRYYHETSCYYKILDIITSPFLNSKLVVALYGVNNRYGVENFEIIVKLFDYENEFNEYHESWDLLNCHLLDMITHDKSIIFSIKNQLNKFVIIIYDSNLNVQKSLEHQFCTDSLFANDTGVFLVYNQVPFIHAYDWNLSTEFKSFGQDRSPEEAFFMTTNDEILIKLDKLLTFNIDNLLVRIYNLNHGNLLKEINFKSFFSSSQCRVLITIDNDEKLILASLDEKFLQVYNSINENEAKILYQRNVSDIVDISSINITNNGLLLLNDSAAQKVYLF